MVKLFLFMMVSLDGYFEGPNHEIDWHNADNSEFNEFAIEQLKNVGTILFGRKTYQMMADYWLSEPAMTNDPIVAGLMNSTPKIVFSKTLTKPTWNKTSLMTEATQEGITKLKETSEKDLAILGSNNLCVSLMEMGLVDEFRIMINPVVLGVGHNLFTGIKSPQKLNLTNTRNFNSGNVLLYYH